MNFVAQILKRRSWSVALWLIVSALGVLSYNNMPTDLFPDTVPPQIVVMTVVRGASAQDVNRQVTTLIDRELKGLTGVVKVDSTSKDEISSVNAQFTYGTDIGEAMTDVINAVNRVEGRLPSSSASPQFFRVTDANRPIMTLSVNPKVDALIDLKATRLLVENDIKEEILRLPGVGRVDVFGANDPEILVRMDLNKLREHRLSPAQVLRAIGTQNVSIPTGYLESEGRESLVKVISEARAPEDLGRLPVAWVDNGIIRVEDVAEVALTIAEPRSLYHGNAKPAIAMNILKPEGGFAVEGIESVRGLLPELEARYSELEFAITTDQEPIISINIEGMKAALFSAIWMTMLIVFLFLGEWRTSVIIGVSIPLAFLSAFAFLYFTSFTVNMVTLSALIISVGMVVDASIVVVENVFRHLRLHGRNEQSVINGTTEVIFSVWGGMLTTVSVMVPIMFVGGYPQQVLRPLTMTITATLIGSFVAAITIVPILLKKLLVVTDVKQESLTCNEPNRFERIIEQTLNSVSSFYLSLLHIGLKARVLTIALSFVLLLISTATIMPLIGRELMPRMDTGQIIIKADMAPSASATEVAKAVATIEKIINANEHVLSISTVAGAEPGQVSFGAGGQLLQQFEIQVRLTTRDQRTETIWDITNQWRQAFAKIPEFTSFSVTEFGATPMATTKAPIDVLLTGRDPAILYDLAEKFEAKMRTVKGLDDIRLNWSYSKPETHFEPDLDFLPQYHLSPADLGDLLAVTLSGRRVSALKMDGFIDLPIRAELGVDGKKWTENILQLPISDAQKEIYLESLGNHKPVLVPTLVTRENLSQSISILGINSGLPLSAVADDVQKIIDVTELPAGYNAQLSGSMADMAEVGVRMAGALIIGLITLYIVLYVLFECWWRPVLVMGAIPLSLIGALWGMVIFDKPMCMPAMMGIILLGGTIVNNAIILIDFIDTRLNEGLVRRQALEEAISTRLRPVLITTFSTVIGLMPLTFERAVGLERMSPLGVVASLGLLAGTIMTMVMIPIAYDLLADIGSRFSSKK